MSSVAEFDELFNLQLTFDGELTTSINDLIEEMNDEVDPDDELDTASLLSSNNFYVERNAMNSSDKKYLTDEEREAHQHIVNEQIKKLCTHEECNEVNLKEITRAFADFDMNDKINYIRAILFSNSSKAGLKNSLLTNSKKRKSCNEDHTKNINTSCYSFLGNRVCLQSFAAAIGLYIVTVQRHAREVTLEGVPTLYESKRNNNRTGIWGVQRCIVKAF